MNGISTRSMDKKALKKRARALRVMNAKRRWQLFLFLLIPVIWVIIFNYVPMVGVQIAFRKYKMRDGIWGSRWVGFANFIKFFNSYQFQRVLDGKTTTTDALVQLLSERERQGLRNALTSTRMEGFEVTEQMVKDCVSLMRGEVSVEELVDTIVKRP